MKCPECNSEDIADTLYGTDNNKIVTQGYICDDCGHEWERLQ